MKCAICRTGETNEGIANVTLNRGKTTVLIKLSFSPPCSTTSRPAGREWIETSALSIL